MDTVNELRCIVNEQREMIENLKGQLDDHQKRIELLEEFQIKQEGA